MDECKICQSNMVIETSSGGIFCEACNNHYFFGKKRNINSIKSLSNKKAHFNNVMKQMREVDISKNGILTDMKKYIENFGLDTQHISVQFINEYIKTNKIKQKKSYILYYNLLYYLKNEISDTNTNFVNDSDIDIIKIITSVFQDYNKYLCLFGKINETINYNLVISNILSIFGSDTNVFSSTLSLKDEKVDLWNKYISFTCDKYLNNKVNKYITIDGLGNSSYKYYTDNHNTKKLLRIRL